MRAWALLLLPALACAALPEPGDLDAPADSRYCGEPARDAKGRIVRSEAVKRRFAWTWPCPSTGSYTPHCPGWQIDHVIPLARGGCDLPHNLQWLPVEIKLCTPAAPKNKDCWEREVYQP